MSLEESAINMIVCPRTILIVSRKCRLESLKESCEFELYFVQQCCCACEYRYRCRCNFLWPLTYMCAIGTVA